MGRDLTAVSSGSFLPLSMKSRCATTKGTAIAIGAGPHLSAREEKLEGWEEASTARSEVVSDVAPSVAVLLPHLFSGKEKWEWLLSGDALEGRLDGLEERREG